MSEKIIPRHEQHVGHEKVVAHEHQRQVHEHLEKQAEKARREKSSENIEKIKKLAEAEAKLSEKIALHENEKPEPESGFGFQQMLKSEAFDIIMSRTRQKLSKPARTFSKFAHRPVVDKISGAAAQTLARPSGILGGSICAFAGSLLVYYFAKYYGFEYNFVFVFLLFAAGYVIGAFLELVLWAIFSRRQRY